MSCAVTARCPTFWPASLDGELVINTGTTIVTFLMVFLIQQSQNKDSVALHPKLNELLAASKQASNRMIGIEELDEQDLRKVADFHVRLAARARDGTKGKETHSIDEEGMPTDTALWTGRPERSTPGTFPNVGPAPRSIRGDCRPGTLGYIVRESLLAESR